jgi:hypothetical protein
VGDGRNACKVLIGKPEGEIALVRPRSRWKDDIRVDVKLYVRLWCLLIWHKEGNSAWLL